jgi:hypothetical protein
VVFDRPVDWTRNVHIMNWVALESGNENLKRWVTMQCIKETSTLRYSKKGNKPIPKVVFRFGSQNRMIRRLLKLEDLYLNFLKQMKKESDKESVEE